MNYYNEFDPKAAAWLRELISAGLIPAGDVDERSICDVQPGDLRGYTQCHFFAGIGGWSRALQLAGWPTDRPVWTGSCPCQPFSAAGKQLGTADERHLWPVFFRLIAECRPTTCFGEQVASRLGREWLAGVRADLEGVAYEVGASDLCAAGIRAPHIRQRLWWVADARCQRDERRRDAGEFSSEARKTEGIAQKRERCGNADCDCGSTCGLANSELLGGHIGRRIEDGGHQEISGTEAPERPLLQFEAARLRSFGRLADRNDTGPQGREQEQLPERSDERASRSDVSLGFWDRAIWHLCRDGKARRISPKPGIQFMVDWLSDLLGDRWNTLISKAKEVIEIYAKETKRNSREALLTMWNHYEQEAIQWQNRGCEGFYEKEILLIAMRELARCFQHEFIISTQDFREISEGSMRVLRIARETSCPSYQRELDRPFINKPENALHQVSLTCGASQEDDSMQSMRESIKEAEDVSKALSAMEDVWKSVTDEDQGYFGQIKIRDCGAILRAMDGFPLSHGLPGRVGILRGSGNAIVPQEAAVFIQAAAAAIGG